MDFDLFTNNKYKKIYIKQNNPDNNQQAIPEVQAYADVNPYQLVVNPITYAKVTEKYSRSFLVMKNAVTNYTVNLDKFMGNQSMLKDILDNVIMSSATRLKYYPVRDVISYLFNQNVLLFNNMKLSYEVQGKFKVPYLLEGNMERVLQKNQHTLKIMNWGLFNTMRHESTLLAKKSQSMNKYNKIIQEHMFLMMPWQRVYLGFFAQGKHSLKTNSNEFSFKGFNHLQVSVMKNVLHTFNCNEQNLNYLLAILNVCKYTEGNIGQEVNLKLNSNYLTGDFKMLKSRRTDKWTPKFDLQISP